MITFIILHNSNPQIKETSLFSQALSCLALFKYCMQMYSSRQMKAQVSEANFKVYISQICKLHAKLLKVPINIKEVKIIFFSCSKYYEIHTHHQCMNLKFTICKSAQKRLIHKYISACSGSKTIKMLKSSQVHVSSQF